jgi:hypothetical protein
MKLIFQIYADDELHDLGIIDTENGEVVEEIDDGFEDWIEDELSLPTTPNIDQTDELLRTYDGPHLVVNPIDEDS